jgi:hypothetical protein
MEQAQQLVALILVAGLGILATLVILRRQRRESSPPESRFAASTEGEKRCPKCGMGNMWTDRNCIVCHARLPG